MFSVPTDTRISVSVTPTLFLSLSGTAL
jgi:hypothetical protein